MAEKNINDFPEFNEDCYEECEDHFKVIRRNLLELEKFIDSKMIDQQVLDELSRSFHTLKGLTGMIGQRDAEKLAHLQENILNVLSGKNIRLSEPLLNGLFEGLKGLESIIDALKKEELVPDLKVLTEKLNAVSLPYTFNENTNGIKEEIIDIKEEIKDIKKEMPKSNGNNFYYTITFSPSTELFEKGINVTSIKKQIESIGEIKRSNPVVLEAGKVAFEFTLYSNLLKPEIEKIFDSSVNIVETKIFEDIENQQEVSRSNSPGFELKSDKTFALTNIVRVDLNRLDDLMKMVGDLVVSRSRLEDQLKGIENKMPTQESRILQETVLLIERQLRLLREGVMRIRLIPIGEIFERMHFVIRDMIKESKKDIILNLSGKETEIDKIVVEKMLDPLLHLVRNAVSHGIETSEERIEKGKSPKGQIFLRAFTSGDSVIIEVQDDGIGIDKKKVLNEAIERGIIAPQEDLTDTELLEIIFSQGFSTRKEADMASGRGVGMAVVKKIVQELGGTIELDTEIGLGTKFTLQLPLTLAIIDALILKVGGHRFAMPQPLITEVLRIEAAAVTHIENNQLIPYRNGVIPVINLSNYFNLPDLSNGSYHVLVVGMGSKAVGLMADKILSLKEIVVRPIPDQLIHIEGVSGATELGDSQALLILDPTSLIKAITQKKINIKNIKSLRNKSSKEVKL